MLTAMIYCMDEREYQKALDVLAKRFGAAVLESEGTASFADPRTGDDLRLVAWRLVVDEALSDSLCAITNGAQVLAARFSNHRLAEAEQRSGLHAIVHAAVQKWSYEPPASIFALVAELTHAILTAHKLEDGNKRTAFAFAVLALRFFGYSFFPIDLKGEPRKWARVAERIVGFVVAAQSTRAETNAERVERRQKGVAQVEAWLTASAAINFERETERVKPS